MLRNVGANKKGDKMTSIEKLKIIEAKIGRPEAARQMGVAYNTWWRWVSGENDPDASRNQGTARAINRLYREIVGKD
jgi:hypothetical protein